MASNRKSLLLFVGVGVIALVVGLYVIVHLPPVQAWAFKQAVSYLGSKMNLDLSASDFRYRLAGGTVVLTDVELRALGAKDLPPLLKAKEIEANLDVTELISGEIALENVRVKDAEVNVITTAEGRTNLPPSDDSESGPPPRVRISDASVSPLRVNYRNAQQQIEFESPSWSLNIAGSPPDWVHKVKLDNLAPGIVRYQGRELAVQELSATADWPLGGTLQNLQALLATPENQIRISGDPMADPPRMSVAGDLNLAPLVQFAAPEVDVSGPVHLEAQIRGPWDAAQADVKVASDALRYQNNPAIAVNLDSQVSEAAADIRSLEVSSRGLGQLSANGRIAFKEGEQSEIEGRLNGINVPNAMRMVKPEGLPVQLATTVSGPVEVRWTGTDFQTAEGSANLRLTPRGSPAKDSLPLDGRINIRAAGERVRVTIPSLRTLSAEIQAQVTIRQTKGFPVQGEWSVVAGELSETAREAAEVFGFDPPKASGELAASGTLQGPLEDIRAQAHIQGNNLSYDTIHNLDLSVDATYDPDGIALAEGRLQAGSEAIQFEGKVGLGQDPPTLAIDARGDNLQLGEVLAVAGQEAPADTTFSLNAQVRGTTKNPQVQAQVQGQDLIAYDETFGNWRADLEYSGNTAVLQNLTLQQPDGGQIQGTATFNTDTQEVVANLAIKDLKLDTFEPKPGQRIQASVNGTVDVRGPVKEPQGTVELKATGTVIGDRELGEVALTSQLSGGNAQFQVEAPKMALSGGGTLGLTAPFPVDAEFDLKGTDLSNLGVQMAGKPLEGTVTAKITASGPLDNLDELDAKVRVEEAKVQLPQVLIENVSAGEVRLEDGLLVADGLELRADGSFVRLNGGIPLKEGSTAAPAQPLTIEGSFNLSDVVAAAAPGMPLTAEGTAKLSGTVTGSLERPDPSVKLTLENGLVDHPELLVTLSRIGLDVSYDDGLIQVGQLQARLGPGVLQGQGQIPLEVVWPDNPLAAPAPNGEPAKFSLTGKDFQLRAFRQFPEDMDAWISFNLQSEADKVSGWEGVRAELTVPEMRFEYGDFSLAPQSPMIARLNDGTVTVERTVLEGPESRVEFGGTAELIGEKSLAMDLNAAADAGLISLFVPDAEFGGRTQVNLKAAGTVEDPLLNGTLAWSDGIVSLDEPRLDATGLDVQVAFEGRSARIETFRGNLNGGDLTISGNVQFPSGRQISPNLQIVGDNVFMSVEDLELANNFNLTIGSDPNGDRIQIGGNVTVLSGILRGNYNLETDLAQMLTSRGAEDQLAEERNPLLERIRLGIDVNTDQPIVIDTNVAELQAALDVRVVGSIYNPGMTGQVRLDPAGRVFLRGHEFIIERGFVSFVSENRIEPVLSLQARAEVAGYEVLLRATGPVDRLDTTLTSNPTLPRPDILSLLITGRTLDELRGDQLNVAQEQTLALLTGAISPQLQDSIGLSRLQIEPSAISNEASPGARLTVGQRITRNLELIYSMNLRDSSDQIIAADYRITRRFNTRVVKQSDNSYRFDFRHTINFGGEDPLFERGDALAKQQLGEIRITGTPVVPEPTIRKELDLKPGKPYSFFKVRDALDELEGLYVDRDLLEAEIRLDQQEHNGVVDLNVKIEAGPEITFVYEGYQPSKGLRGRAREIWKRGVFDRQRVNDLEEALRLELAQDGFFKPEILTRVDELDENRKRILVESTRGPEFDGYVTRYDGAVAMTKEELDEVIESKSQIRMLLQDPGEIQDAIRLAYVDRGYLSAEVGDIDLEVGAAGSDAVFVIPITEGPRYRVAEVEFNGNDVLSDQQLMEISALQPGEYYSPKDRQRTVEQIRQEYWRRGYNDLELEYSVDRRSKEAATVAARFQIAEGRQGIIREVAITGVDRTSEDFVRSQITFAPGQPVNVEEVTQTRKALYDTGAYSFVDINREEIDPAGVQIASNIKPMKITVQVREEVPVTLRYGASFDTDRSLGGIVDVQATNVLMPSLTTGGRFRYDSLIKEARLFASRPFLKGFPFRTTFSVFARRQKFRELFAEPIDPDTGFELPETEPFLVDRFGAQLQITRLLKDNYVLEFSHTQESVRTYSTSPKDDPLFFDFKVRNSPLTWSVVRDTRDDILDATRGSFSAHSFSVSRQFLGSDVDYIKYYGQYFRYFPLSKPAPLPFKENVRQPRWVYATGARVGLADGLRVGDALFNPLLVASERFFAGGGTTIRGFRNNEVGPRVFGLPLGGEGTVILNNEIRGPLFKMFDWVGFVDVGNVYLNIEDFDIADLRKSAGLGLRVRTPYVLIRVDYGFRLDRKANEPRGGFFFSIGQAF